MKITMEEVERIASLTMLHVTDEEKEMLRHNLEAILTHAKKIDELDTEGVEPTAHILAQRNVFHEDVPRPDSNKAEMLQNAPQSADDSFVVPRVVE